MKLTKIFAAMFAVAALTFTACEPKPNGPVIGGEDSTEVVLNIPSVAAPEAGKTTVVLFVPEDTPMGCYAVGTVNSWGEKNTDLMFTAVEGADEGWVAQTFDFASDMAIKVLAIPSDPAVAPGWSYQWGKNIDPENDLEEDNVVILDGSVGGAIELENQGQPKLGGLVDGGVVYIHIKAWATTPIIKPVPAETAAFKHPWGGGDWTYREATKTAEATFELNAIFGGNGVNVATDVTGAGENWYPTDQIEFVGDVAAGDSVNFKFVSEKLAIGKVTITLIEKGNQEPVETKDITVKAKVPAHWTNDITAWAWGTGMTDQVVTCVKEGDWWVAKVNCGTLNLIFRNGADWSGEANQTVDITGIEADACYQLAQEGNAKATATAVDCQ